jgi:hypothetical protein
MSLTSQDYAGLAADAYKDYRPGVRAPGKREEVPIEGLRYEILEHAKNPRTGYQGTIYQHVETGQIVVAHRGTEFDKQPFQDLLYADGSMVARRTNPQADDAIALTRRAIKQADSIGKDTGHSPEVTVTGHSLGGSLAQIAAHHFNLKGETFNAYGAVSLNRRIPEGGQSVLNHVMAADVVSAASPHYGQVRVYATRQEVDRLQGLGGYANNRSWVFDDRSLALAAGASLIPSHRMHNFLAVDGDGKPDVSVLNNPAARRLATQYDPMIDKYRGDVGLVRGAITLGMRSPRGLAEDIIDEIRGPRPAGRPGEGAQPSNDWSGAVPPSSQHYRRRSKADEEPVDFYAPDGPRPGYLPAPGPKIPLKPLDDKAAFNQNPSEFLDRMLAASRSGDVSRFRELTEVAAAAEPGQTLRSDALAVVERQEQFAAQQLAAQQQAQRQMELQADPARVMRM